MPQSNTQTGLPVIPDLGGVPYIGGPTVTGAQGIPTPGQLFPFHNHDDYKATNNGAYPGGMFTMIMPTAVGRECAGWPRPAGDRELV